MSQIVEIVWTVEGSTHGLTERMIWSFGVRTRGQRDLNRFLAFLKRDGMCTVVICDSETRKTPFLCRLPSRVSRTGRRVLISTS